MHKQLGTAVALSLLALPAVADEAIQLIFTTHLQRNLIEQHVYVQRVPGSGQIYRVTPVDQHRYIDAPAYAADSEIQNAPYNKGVIGPFKLGRQLGFTLGDWIAATGTGTYRCVDGEGTVEAQFENLVPHAVYTMWYSLVPRPPLDPFVGLDIPLGRRGGSQSVFRTNNEGRATYDATFRPCLQMGGIQVDAILVIAWHSDGQTYGDTPGPFSTATHVQLIADLPIEY